MKKRVADLSGAELDYAVALAEGYSPHLGRAYDGTPSCAREPGILGRWFHFSTEWEECGPLIEKHVASLDSHSDGWTAIAWHDDLIHTVASQDGPTPLIAACRCIVARHFGEYVEIEG